LQVEIDIEGNKLRFVSLYAPNKNPVRNTFFSNLPDFIDFAVPTFICGDFNAVLNPDLDRRHHPSYAGPSQEVTARERVAALQSLLSASMNFI
jgi:ribosomal protein L31